MRLLLIRHGDPDYEHDTLTKRGCREAELLAESLADEPIDEIYVSPLGRAQKTAGYTLAKKGMKAVTCEWLREFHSTVNFSGSPEIRAGYQDAYMDKDAVSRNIIWDMKPAYRGEHRELYDLEDWTRSEVVTSGETLRQYEWVTGCLDDFLAAHGYERDGFNYHAAGANRKTIALFCHFGVICVLLSHLLNLPVITVMHAFSLYPSSLTEVVTEERDQGVASFRALRVGDISHLKAARVEPSFMGRFCETFDGPERH